MRVVGHGCYIGHYGYNEHTRMFFRALSEQLPVRVRNYTHIPDQSYLDEKDHKILIEQFWTQAPFKAGSPFNKNGATRTINVVLAETDHPYFYEEYAPPKIAYNVWESTHYPDRFFRRLLEFEELWVATEWQKDCVKRQGYPSQKVRVVPEGFDSMVFRPGNGPFPEYRDGRFKFLLFGKWEYRKATTEIVQAFLRTFSPEEPVDLVCSVDNSFPMNDQKGYTTEQYLAHLGLDDERIHVKHFPALKDYVTYLQKGHVFVSCSRAEGWNLPLMQAIACGTPAIASDCTGQSFASGIARLVKIADYRPVPKTYDFEPPPGLYAEPDFDDLSLAMREMYENYAKEKREALEVVPNFAWQYSWEQAAIQAASALREIGR